MALTLREKDVLRQSVNFKLRKGIHPDLESKGYGEEKEGKEKGRPKTTSQDTQQPPQHSATDQGSPPNQTPPPTTPG